MANSQKALHTLHSQTSYGDLVWAKKDNIIVGLHCRANVVLGGWSDSLTDVREDQYHQQALMTIKHTPSTGQ